MTKQRPNGTGTIELTPTGRFRARFAFDGRKRVAIEGSPFATHEEAVRALDGVLAELDSAPVEGMSLLRLGEKAFAQRDREGFRAVADDRYMWATYVEPWELAREPARLIKRGDLRELISRARSKRTKKPLADQSRRNLRNMLSVVFAYGCEHEIIPVNPCTDLRVKSVGTTRETSTFLTLEEATALMAVATDPAITIAIWTGLRPGELRSLCWGDVRLEGQAPVIVVRYGKPGEVAKNKRIRHVELFGGALTALRAMRPAHYAGVTDEDEIAQLDAAPVLPTVTGCHRNRGRLVEPADWKVWKAAAGIKRRLRYHDLRHTCATLLLSGAWGRDWTYEEVKEMLGHSSVKVTERYAHAVGTLAARAGAAMRTAAELPTGCPPQPYGDVAKAAGMLEDIQRCRWDLNPHMPVLQTDHRPQESRGGDPQVGSAWATLVRAEAYARAVVDGDPHAHARALDALDVALGLALATLEKARVA